MAEKFNKGDIVSLKSGGPKMTIVQESDIGDHKEVKCKWFSGNKLQDGWFCLEALVKIEESNE